MPKLKRILSGFIALWLCVLAVTFTYTWVSRNWTPSIKGEDIGIASSGALVISVLSDTSAVHTEVSLNDVVGLAVNDAFVFRQVSSQDGTNFFWKDFSPTVTGDFPAVFYRIDSTDTHKKDYIDTKFCLKLDDKLTDSKYIFIHPETVISYVKENVDDPDVAKAIRISLTYDKEIVTDTGVQTVSETVILGHLDDNEAVINADGTASDDLYMAVLNDADGKTDAEDSGALGHQVVYGLQYFNCGRTFFDMDAPFSEANYNFTRDESRALFTLKPGELKWVEMKIWLEGQDENCVKEIAGEKFDLVLKFDSAFVES
jgi:hypothetical protein